MTYCSRALLQCCVQSAHCQWILLLTALLILKQCFASGITLQLSLSDASLDATGLPLHGWDIGPLFFGSGTRSL